MSSPIEDTTMSSIYTSNQANMDLKHRLLEYTPDGPGNLGMGKIIPAVCLDETEDADVTRKIVGYIPDVLRNIGMDKVVPSLCLDEAEDAYFDGLTREDMVESVSSSDSESPERQVQQSVNVWWDIVKPAVACLQSEVRLTLKETEQNALVLNLKDLNLHVTDKHGNDVKNTISAICDTTFEAKFVPPCEGHCVLHLNSENYEFQNHTFVVDVDSNSPVVTFSDNNSWPLAICVGNKDDIYVAYMHHVVHFSQDGDYLNRLFYDKDCVITDVAFSAETGPTPEIAVAMTGWTRDGIKKSRQQDVRIYNEDGDVVFTFTGKPFRVSFIRIAAFKDKYFVSVKNGVCICDNRGVVEEEVTVEDLSCVSRLSVTSHGDIVIADSWSGCVQVVDRNGNVHQTIQCYNKADTVTDGAANTQRGGISFSEEDKNQNKEAQAIVKRCRVSSKVSISTESATTDEVVASISDTGENELCANLDKLHLPSSTGSKVGVGSLSGVAVDSAGYILISDSVEQSIKMYRQDGSYVGCIDSAWDTLQWPLGIAVSRDGHVFVADHGNGCIKKYKYKHLDLDT